MKISTFSATDNKNVALYSWENVEKPKLVLQIVHGMCEYSARYDHFAKFCNSNGIIVFMNDLRGHGKTSPDTLGYDDGNMWDNNVNDQIMLSKHLKEKYSLPLVVLGHSFGSFITQRLIELDKYPDGYILSGSAKLSGLTYVFGAIIAGNADKKSPADPCVVMANMSFKAYEKRFPGENSWLSVDSDNVRKYNDDPYCGYMASNHFYASFMQGIKQLYTSQAKAEIDVDKPIYIFAGGDDPVGNYGKSVQKLYDWYKKIGIKDLSKKIYTGYRHEMLNETIKDNVYKDVISFLDKFIVKA